MRKTIKESFIILSCLLMLHSCATRKTSGGTNAGLEGKKWELVSADGLTAGDPAPYVEFGSKAGELRGKGGCNGFGGNYSVKGDEIKIEGIIGTKMACDQLTIENAFFKAMESSDRFKVAGNTLRLYQGKKLVATLNASASQD